MSPLPHFFALIPAAGHGTRMALGQHKGAAKQYQTLAGQRVIDWTVQAFQNCSRIAHTYVVVAPDDETSYAQEERLSVLRCGGATRRDSVLNALDHLSHTLRDPDWVLVHDAARPGINATLLHRLIDACEHDAVGGLLALPVADTLKRAVSFSNSGEGLKTAASNADIDSAPRVETTLSREHLWAAQTPQMFSYALLRTALRHHASATDEASAVEALGLQPRLVLGHACNLKITYPSDLALAELFLRNPQ